MWRPALAGPRVALTALLLFAVPARALAQQTASPEEPAPAAAPQTPTNESPWDNITFGTTLEGFYEYNWNDPLGRVNLLRAYDTRANVLGIQQVALLFDMTPDVSKNRRFGLRVDLQFGQATETVQGGAANEPRPDVYRHIWQAYGSYIFPSETAFRRTSASSRRTSGSRPTTRRTTTTSRARISSTSCRSITPVCASPTLPATRSR